MTQISSHSSSGRLVRRGLQVLGFILILAVLGLWLKTGAHTGFSKNRVEIEKVDPITQIEYVDYEERFVMGVEYMGAGVIGGFALIGASFFFGRKK